ncbi:optomotor-blind protein isoform X10 [Canis lupus familiaris]|uniref:optomotor-blind protein isoform X10 n=1 Tax=Canis lupus familiaris TaxID=9615 RepID=UPI000BAA128B|nr:optomotor-blind protein isoform X10 [Canis lupus familiaris]XP_038403097.1 optomotor-blind protein isoform X10 [Canis lupus familiaris]XP_038532248.1 optomotor-blind protein isoform X10 [Canis lupus familiaris]|eukprot:XP_022278638.1 optomotor-blind protein isoform X10 [Canis lupus familiaris]
MKERRLCGARAHWPWCAWRCCCCCGPGEPWGRRCSRSSPPGPGRRTGCPTSRTSTSTWRSSSTAAANTTRTPPANTTKPLPANATKPPRQTTGKPQPPPSSQGPRGEEQVVLPLPPGPSQPVTPAMSRAEMAGAHRGPVPEKLDVRMALS